MDTDRIFVWFVYVSLAAAVALMVVTALPGDGPDDDAGEGAVPEGADDLEEPDEAADGVDGAGDGAAAEDDEATEDGQGPTEGDVDNVSSDEGDGQSIQDETGDPVRISGGTNGSAEANGTENGSYEPAEMAAVESAVVERINERRADAFVPALDTNRLEDLWSIAERHTADMVERDYFAIENPDGVDTFRRFNDLEPPCHRVDNYNRAFEGIARTRYSPWTNSSWHRTEDEIAASLVANYTDGDELTDDLYADVGVDVRFDGDDGYVVSTVAIC